MNMISERYLPADQSKRRPLTFRAWNPDFGMIRPLDLGMDGIMLDASLGLFYDTKLKDYLRHLIPMQFTGLRDIAGNVIYEGDIVRTQEYRRRGSKKTRRKIGVVIHRIDKFNVDQESRPFHTTQDAYDADWAVSLVEHGDDYQWNGGFWSDFFDCEVIGNIFENPELLNPAAA